LINKGFHLVEKNWRCRSGEIDLIMERNGITHFIEVKTRAGTTFGYPEESITPTKLRKLARTIEMYLNYAQHPPKSYQADALAITILPNTEPEYHYVEHIL